MWADLYGATNNLNTRYLRGDVIDELFARIEPGDITSWTLTDRMLSVRDVIINDGTVKNTLVYDGFGKIISESDHMWRGRYAWTGRELDVETKLQYNRARYYDSNIGRWTSQDPIGFGAGDSNLYRYIHNQAVVLTDPSGLQQQMVDVNPLSFFTKAPKQTGKPFVNVHFPTKDKRGFDVVVQSFVKFNPSIHSRKEWSKNVVGFGMSKFLTWTGASDLKGGFEAFLKDIGPGEKYSIEMEMSLKFRVKHLTHPHHPRTRAVVFKKWPSYIKDELNNRKLTISNIVLSVVRTMTDKTR